MDYLTQSKTLFVGTNQKNILTINIEELFEEDNFPYIP